MYTLPSDFGIYIQPPKSKYKMTGNGRSKSTIPRRKKPKKKIVKPVKEVKDEKEETKAE